MQHYSLIDLQLFSAVADELNLTKGAAKVHLTPSSASVRIQKLEEALGVSLLRRKVRGVELTQAGEIVDAYAKRITSTLGEMHHELRPLVNQKPGTIRIAANYGASIDFLPGDISRFLAENPQIRVILEQKSSTEVVERVAQGGADIGISAYRGSYSGVKFLPYQEDRLIIACRRDHPLAQKPQIDFRESLRYDFVGLENTSAMQRFVFDRAEELGHTIEPRIQVDNQPILLTLVHEGSGIAVVSSEAFAKQMDPELTAVGIREDWARRELRIALKSSFNLNGESAAERFAAFIAEGHSA